MRAYLRRVGLEDSPFVSGGPSGELLRAVVAAQVAGVPFENLDIHRGIPVDVDPNALEDKLIARRRGGICYELNGLLARALRGLGFDAQLMGAAVLVDERPGPPLGHAAVVVRFGDTQYLVDSGFGGDALVEEVADRDLADGPVDVRFSSGSAYRTDGVIRPLSDFVAMAHWHSTSPGSRFTNGIVCSVTGADERWTLSCAPGGDYRLTISEGDRREVRDLDDADVVDTLRRRFGIALADPPRPRRIGSGISGGPALQPVG